MALLRRPMQRLFKRPSFVASYMALYRPMNKPQDCVTIALAIFFAVAAGLPLPIIGLLYSRIINHFPAPEAELRIYLIQLMATGSAYFVVTAVYAILWGLIGERITWNLRQHLVQRLLSMDVAYHDTHGLDIAGLLTAKMEVIQIGTSEKVGIFIQSVSYFIAAFAVAFALNPMLAGILFIVVIPAMFAIVYYGSSAVSLCTRTVSHHTEQANILAESAILAVRVIQAFGLVDLIGWRYLQTLRLGSAAACRKAMISALMLGSTYFVAYGANALAFYLGSCMTAGKQNGEAGSVYAVIFLILDASFVLGQFGPFLGAFACAAAAGSDIFNIIDLDFMAHRHLVDTVALNTFEKGITLDRVTFTYSSRPDTKVLREVTLQLRPGTLHAIIGPSGSGKSSLLGLMLQLYGPDSGAIKLGDSDINDLDIATLRSHIAFLNQEPYLFSGTILDNIRFGLSAISLPRHEYIHRCQQAAEDAGVDFLHQLPHGLLTTVGAAGGTQLSGGQKQRICLARALVRMPLLLLLDEPNSALDSASEALVMKALHAAVARGCIVVMVTHRLASLHHFDTITLMSNGRVAATDIDADSFRLHGAFKAIQGVQSLGDLDLSRQRPLDRLQDRSAPFAAHDTHDTEVGGTHSLGPSSLSSPTSLSSMRRCMALNKDHWWLTCIALVLSIICGGIVLGEATTFGHVIHLLNLESTRPDFLAQASSLSLRFFSLAVVALLAYSGSGTAFGTTAASFVAKVQHNSLVHILRQDLEWFSGRSAFAVAANLQSDAAQLGCLSGVALGTMFTVFTSILGGVILACSTAWRIAIVLLFAVPVMVFAGYVRLKVLALSEERHRLAYTSAAAVAIEACRNIKVVVAFGKEQFVLDRFKSALEQPYRSGIKFTIISNLLLALSLSITYFIYALAYWWGSKLVRQGEYSTQDFFIVLPALLFSAQSAGQVFSLAPEMTKAKAAAKRVFALHDHQPRIMRNRKTLVSYNKAEDRGPGMRFGGDLTIYDVSLSYHGRGNFLALQNINFTLQRGETVAIVGASGSGKSTLISMLARFYDPTQGSISLDGTDIRSLPVSEYRKHIALVPQEPDLLPGSIAYNIRLGAVHGIPISDAAVHGVCREIGLHDFVTSLPDGYDTDCGRNGSCLSGGQKQRIAIARALIRDPDVLLLDESTAALDAFSEEQVVKAVEQRRAQRITVVVAHRLSTIKYADKIVVLDGGRVVQMGSHEKLTAQGGLYGAMVAAQVGPF